jgi:hypothetical protein
MHKSVEKLPEVPQTLTDIRSLKNFGCPKKSQRFYLKNYL